MRVPKDLLNRARRKASAENRTLTSRIEDGLCIVVGENRKAEKQNPVMPRVSKVGGRLMPGIDLTKALEIDDLNYLRPMQPLNDPNNRLALFGSRGIPVRRIREVQTPQPT